MRNFLLSLIAAGLILSTLPASGIAQEVQLMNNPTYPLQIVSVSYPQLSHGGTVFHGAAITVQNTGSVPCVAFEVALTLEYSDSEKGTVRYSEDHNTPGYAKPRPSDLIQPGQTYTMRNTMGTVRQTAPEGITITGIEARVDYVQTADGKTYGASVGQAREFFQKGHRERAAERERLLKIYNSKGLQALLKALEQP